MARRLEPRARQIQNRLSSRAGSFLTTPIYLLTPTVVFLLPLAEILSMAYVIQPVNRPYDPEQPMPTPLGFVVGPINFKIKPLPRDLADKTIEIGGDRLVGGDRPMPDFFSVMAGDYYVSSRFRSVLERYALGAVEYIEVQFKMPASKNPADAYYYINVLGRGQLIDWASSNKSGPRKSKGDRRAYVLNWPPDQWTMKAPPPGHPAIWREVDKEVEDLVYRGSSTHVFVTNELADALNTAFPGQVRLYPIREV